MIKREKNQINRFIIFPIGSNFEAFRYSIQFLQLTVDSFVFENRFLESDIRYQFPKMKNEATAFVLIHYIIIIINYILYYIII